MYSYVCSYIAILHGYSLCVFCSSRENSIADYWMVNNFNTNELNLWMVYRVAT